MSGVMNRLWNGGCVLMTMCVFLTGTTAAAVTNIWQGDVSSAWSDTGNWSLGTVPTSGEDVLFPDVANQTVDLGGGNGYGSNIVFDAPGAYIVTNGTVRCYASRMYQNGAGTVDFYALHYLYGAEGGWAGTGTGKVSAHGIIWGPGYKDFWKSGANFALRLDATNTYPGNTVLAGGVLEVMQGRTDNRQFSANGTDPKILVLGTDSAYPFGTDQWVLAVPLTIRSLDATSRTVSNKVSCSVSSLTTDGTGNLDFASNVSFTVNGFVVMTNSNPETRMRKVTGNWASGAYSIRKYGTGRLVVGDSDRLLYIYGGELFLNGTFDFNQADVSPLTLATGTLLGGTGNFVDRVQIQTGATLSPGENGAGTMTFGTLDIQGGATLKWDVGLAAQDTCVVTNTLTLGATATLHLTNDGSIFNATREFVLFSYPAAMTDPANPTWTFTYSGKWTSTNAVVSVDTTGNRVVLTGVAKLWPGTVVMMK